MHKYLGKYIWFLVPAIIVVFFACTTQQPQAEMKQEDIDRVEALDEREYVFVAKQVSPQRGGMWPLTTYYDMVVSADSVNAQLPYFGRAFTAPLDPWDGGISFISTDFAYQEKRNNKGRWTIEIEPRDEQDIRRLILTVFTNGDATLRVSSLNREMITFNGHVEPRIRN